MEPTIPEGSTVLVLRAFFYFLPLRKNQIVVVKHPFSGRLLLKRVKKTVEGKVYVTGDNKNRSTDSRSFGWIERKSFVGSVLTIL